MPRLRLARALLLLAALGAAPAARAIDFTLLQVGSIPSALCASSVLTDVTGVAVSYNLLDNGGNANVRFSWTITSANPTISQSLSSTLDPESAVQTDVQDWFDQYFGGSIPVPGNPPIPWTGVIVATPINASGNPVGQSSTFTVQCVGTGQASLVNVGPLAQPSSFPVPVDAPLGLAAAALALAALGARRLRARR
jgi:hypothetical protein